MFKTHRVYLQLLLLLRFIVVFHFSGVAIELMMRFVLAIFQYVH